MSWYATRTILIAELRGLGHRLMKRNPVRLALLALLLLSAGVVLGGGVFGLGVAVGKFLPEARDSILAGGFSALSVLMLVLGFPTVIASFFVGRDLLQLVLAPVRPVEIFVTRLVFAAGANLLISSVVLMGILGLGVGSAAPVAYFPVAVLLLAAQIVAVTSVQVVLMSIILQWVPARIARDVAAAVAGLTATGFYLAWNLSLRQSFSPGNRPDISRLTSTLQRVDWLPTAWPGHSLSALIAGDGGAAATWLLLSLALAGMMLAAAEILYSRTLLAGLGVFGGGQAVWRPSTRKQSIAVARAGVGSPTRAIARKDWLGYRRDVRRLTRLIPALLFPIGYAVSFLRPGRNFTGFWTELLLIGFISMFMATALATPAIPSERRGFQLLRLAPLTVAQIIRAKITLTLPPVLSLTLLFGIVTGVVSGTGFAQLVGLALLVVWLGVGFVTIGVSAGAIDPRFEASDDRRAVGVVGSLTGLGGSLGFAVLSVGAFALLTFGGGAIGGQASHVGSLNLSPAIGALMCVAAVVLAAGAVTVVGLLLWLAGMRLSSYQGAIATI